MKLFRSEPAENVAVTVHGSRNGVAGLILHLNHRLEPRAEFH